jgi:thiol-disulfide isomerase/thioredoxin
MLGFLANACTNADANVNAPMKGESAKVIKTAKSSVAKDTTAPKQTVKRVINKRPNNYSTSKSRQKADIVQEYPYDLALTDGKGNKTSTDKIFKTGKPTVVLFWLTTCYPCKIEMAAIQKKYDQWKEETDFNLVAVSTDFDKNYEKYLKMVEEKNWPWDVYHDTNREFRKVMPGELNGLPQTFVFDKDGNIAMHKKRFRPGDEDKLYEEIKLLAAK